MSYLQEARWKGWGTKMLWWSRKGIVSNTWFKREEKRKVTFK